MNFSVIKISSIQQICLDKLINLCTDKQINLQRFFYLANFILPICIINKYLQDIIRQMSDPFDDNEDRLDWAVSPGTFGKKEHVNVIKIKKSGFEKHVTVEQGKTFEQMIHQFDLEELNQFRKVKNYKEKDNNKQNEEKKQKEDKKYVAVATICKSKMKIQLNNKVTVDQLFKDGLTDIQLEEQKDQKGMYKYPQLPEYKQPKKYFQSSPKIVSKVKQIVILIKLIYQSIDKDDKVLNVQMSTCQTILDLKIKAADAFHIPQVKNILLEDSLSMMFQKDSNTLYRQGLNQDCEIYVRFIQNKSCYTGEARIEVYYPATKQSFKVQAQPSDLIGTIKKKVALDANLKEQDFTLIFVHKQLDEKKSLSDYKINPGDKLSIDLHNPEPVQNNLLTLSKSKLQSVSKWLLIKDNQQTFRLNYDTQKQKTIYEIISDLKKNSPKYFSLLHGDMFLSPTDRLKKVQMQDNFLNSNQIVCILVESAQKKLFYDQILTGDWMQVIQTYSDQDKTNEMIKKFRNTDFNKTLMDQIFRFDPSYKESISQDVIQKLRQVILCFMSIEKYENTTSEYKIEKQNKEQSQVNFFEYDLYKKQKFSGFNKLYEAGQHLYFKEFVQTKKKSYKHVISTNLKRQTVFFLRSLSGRNLGKISLNQDEEEIVFLPFTYFTVDQVIVDQIDNPTCEYIFLTEMETLFNYKDPFLVWVDDLPNNKSNLIIYQDLKVEHPKSQVIKLVSTQQAKGWMDEFAWLMNWQNVKFKIISDMTRYEIDTQKGMKTLDQIKNSEFFSIKQNPSAAIDLIQASCDQIGLTTLITIFCGNKQNAIDRVKARNLTRGLNYHEIIVSNQELKSNINDFLNP